MSGKHGLSLSFSKSQPWGKELGASSLFGRWPRKHGESADKGGRGANQLDLLQGQLGGRPAGPLLRDCVERTSELSPCSSRICTHRHRRRRMQPAHQLIGWGPVAELRNPWSHMCWGHTSHAPLPPVTACGQDTKQTCSWETGDSFLGDFGSRTSCGLCWTFPRSHCPVGCIHPTFSSSPLSGSEYPGLTVFPAFPAPSLFPPTEQFPYMPF